MTTKIEQYQYLPPGQIVLKRAGETVWRGSLSAPWDDVEYDTAVLCPEDYARLTRLTNDAWVRGSS